MILVYLHIARQLIADVVFKANVGFLTNISASKAGLTNADVGLLTNILASTLD
jgi:hypothetical protein